MEEEARACLKRLRGSRLKSQTASTLIHILSRCYEDPEASRILSTEPTRSGGSGDEVSDGVAKKVDVVNDVASQEVKKSEQGDDQQMEFSVDDIENMIMDIDVMEGPVEGNITDQEALQQVQNSLLETAGLGNLVDERLESENGFSNAVEFGFTEGEAAQCGNENDKCAALEKDVMARNQHLDRPVNALECANAQTSVHGVNGSDDIEDGEIDNFDTHVQSHVSQENNIEIIQHTEAGADQPSDIKQRKLPGEVSCPDFSSSVLVGNAVNENGKYHQASSDACAGYATVKSLDTSNSTSEAQIKASIAAVANDGFKFPIDRSPVFYGDISEASPNANAQGTLKADADNIKKKRGGNSKEKKKIQKRKKRAEMDKKLGVKRMKLPPALKPKVVQVCEHYLKGRCLKGGECTFSHDAIPLTKSKACSHFARNQCMKGDACPYDHQLWKYPCNNYASKGFCNRGSSCLFSHEIPAKEGSQGASVAEKTSLQATPIPGTASKGLVNSAAKISMNPPVQVPKGLSFLSLGKSGSDHLTGPDPKRSPQKVELMGSNHSIHNVPGTAKTLDATSIPFATPVTSNHYLFLEAPSDHSENNKNSVITACSSKKMVDLSSPLDQALLGLNSLLSSRVPVNRFSNECCAGLSAKEHSPPLSRLSGLNMHQSFGSSVEKMKSGSEVVDRKGQLSKSKSQVVANMCEGATQEKVSEVQCFSSKSSTNKDTLKLNTTIPKDQKIDDIFPIQVRGKQSVYGNPHSLSAEELKSPASVPPSFSQGMAAKRSMPTSVQKALISTSTLALKFGPETKGSSLGSAGNSQLQTKPESSIASSGKSAFKCEPVKASAILDFIFGTGSKTT